MSMAAEEKRGKGEQTGRSYDGRKGGGKSGGSSSRSSVFERERERERENGRQHHPADRKEGRTDSGFIPSTNKRWKESGTGRQT